MRIPDGIQKMAVFRALQLGDMLCSIPALRAIRCAYPEAEIVLLGLPWAQMLVSRYPDYLDRFIHFPGYEGLPEQPYNAAAFEDFRQQMIEERFDLIWQMQGNGTIVNHMLTELGAAHLAGFHNENSRMENGFFIEYPCFGHEIERHLLLAAQVGIPIQGNELEFPLYTADRDEARHYGAFAAPYICLHPGSRGSWRQWPPACFALLADHCAALGYTIVVTGTKDEAAIASEVTAHMHYPAVDLTGRTSIGGLAAVLEKACFLVSNCTGVSHLSAALKIPSVVISMDGEPERWGPLNHDLHLTIDWTTAPALEEVLCKARKFIDKKIAGKQTSSVLTATINSR